MNRAAAVRIAVNVPSRFDTDNGVVLRSEGLEDAGTAALVVGRVQLSSAPDSRPVTGQLYPTIG